VGNNTFIGPGRFAVHGGSEAYVSPNTIIGYDVGVRLEGAYGPFYALDNRIEHCSTAGISAAALYIECLRDTIMSYGTGMVLSGAADLFAKWNLVQSCVADGMSIQAGHAEVDSNIVGHCGGDGIAATLEAPYPWWMRFRNNTSYLNGGSGFVLALTGPTLPHEVDHNVGYGNGRHGLEMTTSDSLTLTCNDWFANTLGAVQGIEPSPTDLAIDPLFCDASQDDVRLASNSSLADSAGCGPIGAFGIGCETTPVLVDQFSAWRETDGRVVIGWRVHGEPSASLHVERAEDPRGPWASVVGTPEPRGQLLTLVDPAADPARAHWYRLIEGAFRPAGRCSPSPPSRRRRWVASPWSRPAEAPGPGPSRSVSGRGPPRRWISRSSTFRVSVSPGLRRAPGRPGLMRCSGRAVTPTASRRSASI